LLELVARQGLLIVFLNVFLHESGIPLPAEPTLLVAGSLAASGLPGLPALVGVALLAVLIPNIAWYLIGRRFGGRVLALLCRMSLSPDSCVTSTQNAFARWGGASLVAAKFIPGFSIVAPPLAGAARMRFSSFLVYDLLGALLWAGACLGAGFVFHRQIVAVLAAVDGSEAWIAGTVVAVIGGYLAWKIWRRRRGLDDQRLVRISVEDLKRLVDEGHGPVVIDVRNSVGLKLDPYRIPGAMPFDPAALQETVAKLPAGREVVVYCTCPNDAGAAQVARLLMDLGIHSARPLHGGLRAWLAAGYPVERDAVAA
jgi:membrane protein DedA with SNARE-associated domain/rhodanese-related sulfurtransferase